MSTAPVRRAKMQDGFKKVSGTGRGRLVPVKLGGCEKTRGRGRPRPFLESTPAKMQVVLKVFAMKWVRDPNRIGTNSRQTWHFGRDR